MTWMGQHEWLHRKQKGACYYCNRQMLLPTPETHRSDRMGGLRCTIDHKIPRARGGSNRPANKVAACDLCNQRKGLWTETEFKLHVDANVILWLREVC